MGLMLFCHYYNFYLRLVTPVVERIFRIIDRVICNQAPTSSLYRSLSAFHQRKSQPTSFFRVLQLGIISLFNLFRPSVAFHMKNSHSFILHSKTNDWFLYEMQHWVEMGQKSPIV